MTMSHAEIVMAARIIEGCRQSKRVLWAVDGDVTRVLEGTLRHLSDESGYAGYADQKRHVMTQFIHITATFEHWIPVDDAMQLMTEGLFKIQD